MKRKQKIPVITKRIVTAIIVVGFLLCTAIATVGYRAFSRQFRIQYDENIRSIADAARETLNPDRFAQYLANPVVDDEYKAVMKILQDFVDKFNLNLIYVSAIEAPEYSHITYLYNAVKKDGKWKPFPLGYSEVYVEPEHNASAKRVYENGETIVRHTLKTRSGSHITAMVPVYDSQGKVIAVLGAQKSIQQFVNAGQNYMRLVLIVEVVFGIVFFLVFTLYFSLVFIRPLTQITRETDHFASYGGEPADHLLSIKNRDEIGTLAHSVHQMEYDVCQNIKQLTEVTAEKERISTELSVATKIQLDALPKEYPAFPERKDFDVFATMSPAKEVGGDLYDYMLLDDDHLLFSVGDVSGKGVPAALFMMTAKTFIDSYAEQKLSPKEIIERTNAQLCRGNETGLFVTVWLGILTFSTGELRYVNAGHPFPVLCHNGQFSYLREKPNFVVGGMEGLAYTEHSVTLSKGDSIFVYSDGVTEATDANDQLFGEERLMQAMQSTKKLNVPDTLTAVRKSIDEFVGEAEQFDDITMLQFSWK